MDQGGITEMEIIAMGMDMYMDIDMIIIINKHQIEVGEKMKRID